MDRCLPTAIDRSNVARAPAPVLRGPAAGDTYLMDASSEISDEGRHGSVCWCCGSEYPEARIIRLGARPEAGVCLQCTISLRSAARRREPHAGNWPARTVLEAVDRARGAVMRRRWQHHPIFGSLLRRINRHLP